MVVDRLLVLVYCCFSLALGQSIGAYFRHKTVIIPHDQKKYRGGEDAASTSDSILVVADGVGGWVKQKINPGLYSRLLTRTIVELADPKKNANNLGLKEIVHKANWAAAEKHLGSATCTAVRILNSTTLATLNIGDSGYSIHRVVSKLDTANPQDPDGSSSVNSLRLVYASEPGQKRFNFPHQIGGKYGDVVANVAHETTHEFQEGDIIVVYSDGVSDNLEPLEFHECIQHFLTTPNNRNVQILSSYSMAADCIARTAYVLGKDKTFDSPFAKGARAAGNARYRGGKHDDITVTVAQVFVGVAPSEELVDPHYEDSVFVYTGAVPPASDLKKDEKVTVEQEL